MKVVMINSQIFSLRPVSRFIKLNKKLYLIALAFSLLGLVFGVVFSMAGDFGGEVYASTSTSLYELIISDYSAFGLLWDNITRLILPLVILFVVTLSRFTFFLSYVYLGYQSALLGASLVGLVLEKGTAGIFNGIIVVLPINILNFFILISGLVIFLKRLSLQRTQRIKLVHSVKIFMPKLIYVFVGALFASVVYAFIYPLLLKSVLIINY